MAKITKRVRQRAAVIALTLAGATAPAVGWASDEVVKDSAYYEAELTKWSAAITKLEQADTQRVAAEPVGTMRTLLGEAKPYIADERFGQAEQVLTRVALLRKLAALRIDRHNLEAKAKSAEAEAEAQEAKAKTAKEAADAAVKRHDELESEGL